MGKIYGKVTIFPLTQRTGKGHYMGNVLGLGRGNPKAFRKVGGG